MNKLPPLEQLRCTTFVDSVSVRSVTQPIKLLDLLPTHK